MKKLPLLVTLLLLAFPLLLAADQSNEDKMLEQFHKVVGQRRKALKITPASLTDEQVVAAMKRGVEFLLNHKEKDIWDSVKSWEKDPRQGDMTGGESALVLYALLEAGRSLDDPRLRPRSPELAPAVDYIANLHSDRTYVVSLQSCVLALLPQSKDQKYATLLNHNKELLLRATDQNAAFGYSLVKANNPPLEPLQVLSLPPYHGHPFRFNWRWDNSNSQYALLALWNAADADASVPLDFWGMQDAIWRFNQCKSGAWTYTLNFTGPVMQGDYQGKNIHPVSPESLQTRTMTAAGIASLYITQEFLDTDVRLEPRPDPAIAAGLKRFSETFDPLTLDSYYLYGVSRIALASGYKYFNNLDWYREVACTFLANQDANGSWQYGYDEGSSLNIGTAYALLVLARGRNPILFNKLEYPGGGGVASTWNARPRDTANLTRWASKTFERPLNWQIVNLAAPANEWLDAPILVITGSRDPKFSSADLAKFKAFTDAGGLIFSSADGNADAFTNAIKKYAPQLSEKPSEFKPLPKDHPIFSIHYDIKSPPPMLALSSGAAGAREIWIHSPTDLAAAWQKKSYIAGKTQFEIPANLYFYATGGDKKKLTPRLQPLTPTPAP